MSSSNTMWHAMRLALSLGFVIALPLVIFTIAGVWLDEKFHTSPLFLLGGIALGVVLTVFNIYKVVLPFLVRHN